MSEKLSGLIALTEQRAKEQSLELKKSQDLAEKLKDHRNTIIEKLSDYFGKSMKVEKISTGIQASHHDLKINILFIVTEKNSNSSFVMTIDNKVLKKDYFIVDVTNYDTDNHVYSYGEATKSPTSSSGFAFHKETKTDNLIMLVENLIGEFLNEVSG